MPTFPRPVPPLHTQPKVNELNFSPPQIVSIQSAMTMLMPSYEDHTRKIAVILFERHPHYLQLFRQYPSDNQSVHAFCPKIMDFLLQLAVQGLDDPDLYSKLVSDFVRYSISLGLSGHDIAFLLSPAKEYILEELNVRMTDTLREALDIFFGNIEVAFEKEGNRMRTTMLFV